MKTDTANTVSERLAEVRAELDDLLMPKPWPNIVAFDPGETTGVFALEGDKHYASALSKTDMLKLLKRGVNEANNKPLFIIEDWRLRADKAATFISNQMLPSQMIGMIIFAAYMADLDFVLQQPAQKEWATDERLKAMGWFSQKTIKEGRNHENDAARHLLHYLCFGWKKARSGI